MAVRGQAVTIEPAVQLTGAAIPTPPLKATAFYFSVSDQNKSDI